MELGKKSIEMCTVLSVCNRHDMMMMIISLEYEQCECEFHWLFHSPFAMPFCLACHEQGKSGGADDDDDVLVHAYHKFTHGG